MPSGSRLCRYRSRTDSTCRIPRCRNHFPNYSRVAANHDRRLRRCTIRTACSPAQKSLASSVSPWQPCAGGGTSASAPMASRSDAMSAIDCRTSALRSIGNTVHSRPDGRLARRQGDTNRRHRKAGRRTVAPATALPQARTHATLHALGRRAVVARRGDNSTGHRGSHLDPSRTKITLGAMDEQWYAGQINLRARTRGATKAR